MADGRGIPAGGVSSASCPEIPSRTQQESKTSQALYKMLVEKKNCLLTTVVISHSTQGLTNTLPAGCSSLFALREQGTKTEYLLAYSNLTQHLQYNKGDNKYIKGFLPALILPGRGPRAARRFVEGLAVPMTERKGIIALHVFLLLLSLAGSP